jgi:hypothetical protein
VVKKIDSRPMFTKRQYIEYLIATTDNWTCTNLADHLDGEQTVSHDAISDFLCREKLTPRGLWETVQPLLQDGPEAYLIVDDSVLDKRYARKMALVHRQYSGAAHGVVDGIGVVNLLHTSGPAQVFYPIDYRVFDPEGDGKSKQVHFREMYLRALADKRIQAQTVLFDSWYASVENLKLIHRTGRYFITTLKRNRCVSVSPEAGYVHLTDLVWDADTTAQGQLIKLKELPFQVRLFVIATPTGGSDWVITNRPTDPQRPMTAAAVHTDSAIRWHIEQFHRDVKQLVGVAKCQCRKARAQRNHVACCYLAWVALHVYARRIGTTLADAQKRLWSDYLTAQLRSPTIQAINWA